METFIVDIFKEYFKDLSLNDLINLATCSKKSNLLVSSKLKTPEFWKGKLWVDPDYYTRFTSSLKENLQYPSEANNLSKFFYSKEQFDVSMKILSRLLLNTRSKKHIYIHGCEANQIYLIKLITSCFWPSIPWNWYKVKSLEGRDLSLKCNTHLCVLELKSPNVMGLMETGEERDKDCRIYEKFLSCPSNHSVIYGHNVRYFKDVPRIKLRKDPIYSVMTMTAKTDNSWFYKLLNYYLVQMIST